MHNANIKVKVTEAVQETPLVKRFKLVPLTGRLPWYSAGAHITTYLQKQDEFLERHYSLAGNPRDRDSYTIAVRLSQQSRGGSEFWHTQVKAGDELEISHPKNHLPVSFEARHHIFIAAGIGITPFMAMMAEMKAAGKSFELHYAAASEQYCPFYSFIQSHYGEQAHFYFSSESKRMPTMVMWNQPIGSHVYFCGPEAMITQFRQAAQSYGYPPSSIHFELFTPPNQGPCHPFEVELTGSNIVLQVPEDRSLLDVLLEKGIEAPYSCKIGGCGSCEVEVEEGEVDHRDFFLSEQEKKKRNAMITCVSRAKSNRVSIRL
ncbi:PDR/VanB family oxidoreductase [Paenibacillus beijingensis]|uniref:Ferredoxin n=1 Tax=Paenibacillus beijingensis TaxID=1126833 RepID=A0A0D5NES6_9BACL|nr:PDR/VanB family oxidoreductase [Paenibacillus beijingensis]AJY73482.1 ferredoxin [Paenibacillus beijingensis]